MHPHFFIPNKVLAVLLLSSRFRDYTIPVEDVNISMLILRNATQNLHHYFNLYFCPSLSPYVCTMLVTFYCFIMFTASCASDRCYSQDISGKQGILVYLLRSKFLGFAKNHLDPDPDFQCLTRNAVHKDIRSQKQEGSF